MTPPRCTLHHVWTAPDVVVTGYRADGTIEVPAQGLFTIGRAKYSRLCIRASLGGMKTFAMFWSAPSFVFKAANPWATAMIDGAPLGGERHVLTDGEVIEIHAINRGAVHRFRVELRSPT